jgi:hypothetical protein
MGSIFRKFTVGLFAAALVVPLLGTGCAARVRVYDPYYHDYHAWAGESGYYVQWEHDTHRNHEDFDRRSDSDKKAYWDWRHSHDHGQH